MNHDLKCHPEHFDALLSGAKTAELRLNDRSYQVGDTLTLRNYDPIDNSYDGLWIMVKVTHILSGKPWLADGYVMLSFDEVCRGLDDEADPLAEVRRNFGHHFDGVDVEAFMIEQRGCPDCADTGQYLGHSADCDSDQCALNGDLYSCDGEMQFCHCEEGQALAKMTVRKS